jgi:PAS domain S-box-containing protein
MKNEDKRIEEIFRSIQDIASGKFSTRIKISDDLDEIDGIATGINMLAEEVQLRIEKYAEEQETLTKTVNQLKELKLELSKSEKLFWQVFQTSPDGISITRISDGIFVEVNRSFEKMTGYARKELIGHSAFDFEMWTNMADRKKMTRQLKQKGSYSNLEADFRVKTGKVQRGLISSSIMNISGEPHMVTISRNITRIRQAERELKVSQKKYQELIQLAPDGIILVDRKGVIEMANSAFLRMTGVKAGEVRGVRFMDIRGFDDQDKSVYEEAFEKILKGAASRPLEMRLTSPSGDLRHIEVLAKALKHEGRITGFQAVVRDITERITAMEIMKASEIRYRTSMDAIHDSIYLVDRDLIILLANDALKRQLKDLGLPVNIVGKHYMEAFPILNPPTAKEYQEIFRKGNTIQKEESFKVADHQHYTDTRLIPILENNKITRVLTIVQDITERKKAEHVQQIMYNISNAVNLTRNLNDLFLNIQNELGKIFDTRNFFIAFYNKEDDTLSLPFFVDEKDAFDAFPAKRTLTGYMIRNDRPILMKDRNIKKLVRSGEIEDVGTPSRIWLGVPLKLKDEIIGALVVQNYEDEQAYSEKDLEILQFVSSQISLSIETRRAYDEVQVEKAYFEQLFEGSPETVVLTDNDGILLRVNSEFEKLFGYTQEEAIGKFIDELIVPVDLSYEARNISKKVANGEKILTETIRQHKDGKLIHVSVLGTPIEIEGGQVAVYGIYRDITDRKNAEIALRDSEEKLRNILYSSPDAITVSDLRGYITECNQAALDIFKCETSEQLLGLNANQFVIPSQREKGIQTLKSVLRNGFVKNIEFEVETLKGNHIFVDLSASLIRDTNDKPFGIATITQDITDRKYHERALEAAKEKAEESDRLKSAFLANMSHEIRTPMNAILGFSELLKSEGLSKETRDEYIKIISSKGNELMLIINDIIDISKIEAGDIKISKSDVEIPEFLRELFRELNEEKSLMNKDEIQFRLKLPENDNPVVHTDPSRLKQILNNLVNNAFKFTHEGFVELGFYSDKWKVVFYVKDTGIGIAEDKKEIIFDRFRQVDESINSEFGGTGLGLAISRHLTTLLGGEIWMESVLQHGSTFSLYLPILKNYGSRPESKKGDPSGEKGTGPIDLSGKKIVIAEDDGANYLYLESFLKRANSQVIWAKDGVQLIEIFRTEPSLDLILMDLKMPVLNGLEATRIIRKTNRDIPVIALTAYAFADDMEKSIQAGCSDFLSKPVKIEELAATLSKYLK